MDPNTLLLSSVATVALLYCLWLYRHPHRSRRPGMIDPAKKTILDAYSEIDPLDNFEWRSTAKRKIWKLKPKYFLTMALETLPSLSDLIAMDNTYIDRIALRRKILRDEPRGATHDSLPDAEDAVLELYSWITSVYLPRRFPSIYVLTEDGKSLYNRALGEAITLTPATPVQALKTLGEHVDTEFLLLRPTLSSEDGSPIYSLRAFVTLSPAGFDLREKLGLSLSEIHDPVPSYKERLEKSMNRFFARLEAGKIVLRTNWGVTRHPNLFVLSGNHLYAEQDGTASNQDAEIEKARSEVVINDCRLRCERQTLHRLPKSGALVFAFKTYLYTLDEIKSEGPETATLLADAIDGLSEGNAPGMEVYKSAVIWKKPVQSFLRS